MTVRFLDNSIYNHALEAKLPPNPNEHCSCGVLRRVRNNADSHSTDWLTQVKVVVVGITEEHKSSNDVSNG